MASASGLVGGIAGNPADVLNVRMQHDAALPAAHRRNYRNVLDGLARTVRDEGIAALFRGVVPNSMRAVLMTASQLASYDVSKRYLQSQFGLSDGISVHFAASLLAGLVATTICSPFDVIKTRVMSSSNTPGLATLMSNAFRQEGLGWMFRGWLPSFIRLGPHTVATFMFLEQHKRLYRRFRGIES